MMLFALFAVWGSVLAGPVPAKAGTYTLPLVFVPATSGTSDTLVVFVSGDGGWAAIDKGVSKVFAANGMPVVGLDALKYFWTRRTPDEASRDLERIVASGLARYGKSRIVLAGYSRGADVLPAMISRLPAATRAKVRLVALLGASPRVEFEFHVADWLRGSSKGVLVKPEVDKLAAEHILCLAGEDDRDSLCPELHAANIDVVILKGSHHFDGNYERLGRIVLEQVK
jgi:type IV secretory pathway VirJ component